MSDNEKGYKYLIQYERAAGVGKTDGFKVQAQGDDLDQVKGDAAKLYDVAIINVQANYPKLKEIEFLAPALTQKPLIKVLSGKSKVTTPR